MDTEYCKLIRFKSGEMIICWTDTDLKNPMAEPIITIHDPVLVNFIQESRIGVHITGENFTFRPWIGLSDSDEYMITSDSIMTIGNVRREARDLYCNYINTIHESRQRRMEHFARADAAESLLREVSPGTYRIVDDPSHVEPLDDED